MLMLLFAFLQVSELSNKKLIDCKVLLVTNISLIRQLHGHTGDIYELDYQSLKCVLFASFDLRMRVCICS